MCCSGGASRIWKRRSDIGRMSVGGKIEPVCCGIVVSAWTKISIQLAIAISADDVPWIYSMTCP